LYAKRVVTRRGDKRYAYLKLVESYRDQGRVRQRLVANLGREDALKASGQLEQLAAAFARLDPPMLGIRRDVGPLLLVRHYVQRLGLTEIIERARPGRGRAQLTTSEVVVAMIANRLCAPSPLYDIAGWASSAALAEVFGIPAMLLNDDRLGRALEAFAPQAEAIRGAVALAAIERFGVEAGRLHLDLTALKVCGAHEHSSLVARGWNADRRVQRQVQVLEATTASGVPLYVRPHPGDAAELTCIGAALERLAGLLPKDLVICADSALGHLKNLCAADRAQLGFVVPLREASGFQARYRAEVGPQALKPLAYVSRREGRLPPTKRTRYRGCLRSFAAADPETKQRHEFRVAYIWSSEEARSVAEARGRALGAAETALGKVQGGLGGRHYKTKEQVADRVSAILGPAVKGFLTATAGMANKRPSLTVARNQAAIAQAAELDGLYALATNLPGPLTATRLLRLYKEQSLVELRHRDLKGPLRVRPIFLHNDDRIQALISIVGLALLIFGLIELDLRRALSPDDELQGLLPEGRAARPTGRNILAAFQGLGLSYTRDGIIIDRLTRTQRRILQLLKVPVPWPEREA
jgi:hypothetical protein